MCLLAPVLYFFYKSTMTISAKDTSYNRAANISGKALSTLLGIVLIIIYICQYFSIETIGALVQKSIRLFIKINKFNAKTKLPYLNMLVTFLVKTVLLDLAIFLSILSYINDLSAAAADDWMVMICWVIPSIILNIIPDLFYGAMQIFYYYFMVINRQMEGIMSDTKEIINPTEKLGDKKYHRMKRFCELSDRIDEIAILHHELSTVTEQFSNACSVQLLAWTVFCVLTFIVKLFMEYIIIASAINNAQVEFMPQLFFFNFLSLCTTFIGLVFVANVCSTTMKEVIS